MPKRMLMIDDDQALLALVKSYFEPDGWDFYSCRTGAEGFEKALEKKPTVILLDLKLPDGDSWNLLRRIKSDGRLRKIPVVMVSGMQTRPEDKVTGLTVGADDYMTKPLDLELLSAKLNALLR